MKLIKYEYDRAYSESWRNYTRHGTITTKANDKYANKFFLHKQYLMDLSGTCELSLMHRLYLTNYGKIYIIYNLTIVSMIIQNLIIPYLMHVKDFFVHFQPMCIMLISLSLRLSMMIPATLCSRYAFRLCLLVKPQNIILISRTISDMFFHFFNSVRINNIQ